MPVTFTPAPHHADPASYRPEGFTAQEFLSTSCRAAQNKLKEPEEVLQCAFSNITADDSPRDLTTPIKKVVPNNNGLPYNDHHALVIRPDDVWLAILSQFNFFVNANAEALRASFVAHAGKRELEIVAIGTRFSMTGLIEKNVVDPGLRHAVLMMATLKEYFAPTFHALRPDWEDILGRLEKLKEYGLETIAWYHLLHPVIARFENIEFWGRVAHFRLGGSGPSCRDGKWLGHALEMKESSTAPETLGAEQFWAAYAKPGVLKDLVFDGTPYHRLDTNKVPPGYAEVDINGDRALSSTGRDDVVRPIVGWWMVQKALVGPEAGTATTVGGGR
ncbi:hypothetical protein B0H16DRAFT_1537706 [Mycena metata]|uniref:Uncharacterized protein n=1 Tax=Mycena metata TaxID=1033252 RepID=A0AAD7J4N8_9AGAR|nr:hypothetical protein B0H16DRAFT_1537706 [Mycena metata]